MAILLKNGAVFLHIPKTGGSWVSKALEEQDLVKCYFSHPHADMERVLNYPRHYFGTYLRQRLKFGSKLHQEIVAGYKFCFVRNPFDWYESYWRYMEGLKWKPFQQDHQQAGQLKGRNWHPTGFIEPFGASDFNQFIRNITANYPGYLSQLYSSYTPPGEVQFIGKQETLIDDLVQILHASNASFNEEQLRDRAHQKVNKSKAQIEKPSWDPNLRQSLFALEQAAFFRYGYSDILLPSVSV